MANEKERLREAQQLILDKKYEEARQILVELGDNPTALKWLDKLNELVPAESSVPPSMEATMSLNTTVESVDLGKSTSTPPFALEESTPPATPPASTPPPTPVSPPVTPPPDVMKTEIDLNAVNVAASTSGISPTPPPPSASVKVESPAPAPAASPEMPDMVVEGGAGRKLPKVNIKMPAISLEPKEMPPLYQETAEDADRFQQAQKLIDEAKQKLAAIPDHPRAARWSSRLEHVDRPILVANRFLTPPAGAKPLQRVRHVIQEARSPQTRHDLKRWLFSSSYRQWMGGMAVVVGVLVFLSFFFMSWVEMPASIGGDKASLTPASIWTAANDDYPTFDLKKLSEENRDDLGFGDIRLIDRFLIFIPLFGIALAAVGVLYLMKRLDTRTAVLAIAGLLIVMVLFSAFWKTVSTTNIRGKADDLYGDNNDQLVDNTVDLFKDSYSTGEYALYTRLGLLIGLFGAGVLAANQFGILDKDKS
ncbi:MAG: hypothetical protein H6673_07520 [Anaerolineales bacterium]|nr:hypothetical protein [Anaerolineales bacterium]